MHTEVTEAGPFEQLLVVHLDEDELDDAKNKAARKLSQELKIKGTGKECGPRQMVVKGGELQKLSADAVAKAEAAIEKRMAGGGGKK